MKLLLLGLVITATPAIAQQDFTPSPLPMAQPAQREPGGGPPQLDPTALTTQQDVRSSDALKELIFAMLDAMQKDADRIRERVTDAERTAVEDVERLQALILQMFATQDQKLSGLGDTVNERFASVQRQIEAGTEGLRAAQASNQLNLSAALETSTALAEEKNRGNQAAIAKSEANIFEQLKQSAALGASSNSAIVQQLIDLKERVDRAESKVEGRTEQSGEGRDLILLAIAVAGGLIGVFGFMRKGTEAKEVVYVDRGSPVTRPAPHV